MLAGFFFPLRHLKSDEPNKIAAFIAAFFTARPIGRIPLGETLFCPQCSDVWGDPRLSSSVKESGRRAEFDTYDASDSASLITHHGPGGGD